MRLCPALATACLCGAVLAAALPGPARAARDKDVTPPQARTRILPAAAAPEALSAPILSGLDYSAVAPPGVFIRIIEDEPYTYVLGAPGKCPSVPGSGLTGITLVSDSDDGGKYEARITLSYTRGAGCANELIQVFDTAADSAYKAAAVANEERGQDVYGISEVRSPLGLNATQDGRGKYREYLAYTALVASPLGNDFANRATPYRTVNGKLQVLRGIGPDCYLLSIDFRGRDFAHSMTLTENVARCVLNRLNPRGDRRQRLDYLTYYPEFELPGLDGLLAGKKLDPRTADLAEQPGEGVGIDPKPIQGDLCPQPLGDGPAWPAAPYRDAENWPKLGLGTQTAPRCSHCLLDAPVYLRRYLPPDTQWRLTREERTPRRHGRPIPRRAAPAPASPAPKCTAKCGPGAPADSGTVQMDCRQVQSRGGSCHCRPKCQGCTDLQLAAGNG